MIYFDNAATTFPKPHSVLQEVNRAVTVYGGNPGRSGHTLSMQTAREVFRVRQMLAEEYHTEVERVIFTYNCTMSLNMAIKGVLADGGHAVCSMLEHNSVLRPLHALASHPRWSYTAVPVYEGDTAATVAAFEAAITPQTKALICTHGSNVSGVVLPLKELGALAKRHHLTFIVDAAQSAGVLPIPMDEYQIDILCMAGHKGLYGITGTGVMLMRGDMPLSTIMEGGTGSASIRLEQPDFLPDRLESGTVGTVGILSVGAGLRFLHTRGVEEIYRHEMALSTHFFENCKALPHIHTVNESFASGTHLPVVSFAVDGMSSMEAVEKLNDAGFALRGGLHCAPLAHKMYHTEANGLVRFSPSAFSSRSAVDRLLFALQNLR